MLCYVMLCYVMLCYVMLCYVMLCSCYVIVRKSDNVAFAHSTTLTRRPFEKKHSKKAEGYVTLSVTYEIRAPYPDVVRMSSTSVLFP